MKSQLKRLAVCYNLSKRELEVALTKLNYKLFHSPSEAGELALDITVDENGERTVYLQIVNEQNKCLWKVLVSDE